MTKQLLIDTLNQEGNFSVVIPAECCIEFDSDKKAITLVEKKSVGKPFTLKRAKFTKLDVSTPLKYTQTTKHFSLFKQVKKVLKEGGYTLYQKGILIIRTFGLNDIDKTLSINGVD